MTNLSAVKAGSSLFARVAYRVGAISTPHDRMFFAPDVRGARIIAWASLGFLIANAVLGLFGDVTRYILWALCLVALFFAVKNLRDTDRLRAIGAVVAAALLVQLLVGFFQVISMLGIPTLLGLAGLYGFFYRGGRQFDHALRDLDRHLGAGWSAYTPKITGAEPVSRVILGPQDQAFLVGFTPGRLERHYNESLLQFDFDPEQLMDFLRAEVRRDLKPVLWVGKPAGADGHYPTQTRGEVNLVCDDAREFAQHLANWDAMLKNLSVTDDSNREQEIRAQALGSLAQALPAGWRQQTGIALASGGQADLLLASPLGRTYVIRISAGSQAPRMDGKGRKLHEELMLASRQLFAEPVIWQPTLRGGQGVLGEMRYVQGSAVELLLALDTAHDEARKGETGEQKQLVVTDQAAVFLPRTGEMAGGVNPSLQDFDEVMESPARDPRS